MLVGNGDTHTLKYFDTAYILFLALLININCHCLCNAHNKLTCYFISWAAEQQKVSQPQMPVINF